MMQISAIIVDDEAHARQALKIALQKYEGIRIVAECEHGRAAVEVVNKLHPQLMFLDIHMPRIDGFDVIDLLGKEAPLVVFVTAYDEFAIRAFEKNALDYLLKPIDPKRLEQSIERVEKRLSLNESSHLNELMDLHKQQNAPLQRILVRDGGKVHIIPVNEIEYIETANDYVAIHTSGETHIKQDRLHNLERSLNSKEFCRIHRSYLINVNFLSEIDSASKDSKTAVLKNGKRLSISRSGYARLKEFL